MGEIVSSFFISLDGVVESPDQWHFPYFDDDMGAAVGESIDASTGLLMGRTLYEEWAQYWPGSTDEPFASWINNAPKWVVSSTLGSADWNNSTLITGDDVAGQVRALKESTDGIIGMSGSATTTRWLLSEGLLDRLDLLVHPLAVGKGHRLFEDGFSHPLTLLSSTAYGTGVVRLIYAPAEAPAAS
ncbi:MAG: dihydrofolate reductase family protein [Thermoleophilia bacterium]